MNRDRELWICALVVMEMHGADAEMQAAIHADELLADGNIDGQQVWESIRARIKELRRESPPPLLQ